MAGQADADDRAGRALEKEAAKPCGLGWPRWAIKGRRVRRKCFSPGLVEQLNSSSAAEGRKWQRP
jgi:hypothetical protein